MDFFGLETGLYGAIGTVAVNEEELMSFWKLQPPWKLPNNNFEGWNPCIKNTNILILTDWQRQIPHDKIRDCVLIYLSSVINLLLSICYKFYRFRFPS